MHAEPSNELATFVILAAAWLPETWDQGCGACGAASFYSCTCDLDRNQ